MTGNGGNEQPTRDVVLDGSPIVDIDPKPDLKDVEEKRDIVRAALALGLFGLLTLIVILGFVLIFYPPSQLAKDDPTLESRALYVQGLLGVVAGLFGSATGFYFASGQSNKNAH